MNFDGTGHWFEGSLVQRVTGPKDMEYSCAWAGAQWWHGPYYMHPFARNNLIISLSLVICISHDI